MRYLTLFLSLFFISLFGCGEDTSVVGPSLPIVKVDSVLNDCVKNDTIKNDTIKNDTVKNDTIKNDTTKSYITVDLLGRFVNGDTSKMVAVYKTLSANLDKDGYFHIVGKIYNKVAARVSGGDSVLIFKGSVSVGSISAPKPIDTLEYFISVWNHATIMAGSKYFDKYNLHNDFSAKIFYWDANGGLKETNAGTLNNYYYNNVLINYSEEQYTNGVDMFFRFYDSGKMIGYSKMFKVYPNQTNTILDSNDIIPVCKHISYDYAVAPNGGAKSDWDDSLIMTQIFDTTFDTVEYGVELIRGINLDDTIWTTIDSSFWRYPLAQYTTWWELGVKTEYWFSSTWNKPIGSSEDTFKRHTDWSVFATQKGLNSYYVEIPPNTFEVLSSGMCVPWTSCRQIAARQKTYIVYRNIRMYYI
jgi:hypothetical protein